MVTSWDEEKKSWFYFPTPTCFAMLNPQALVDYPNDTLCGSQFETILPVQTSQAHKRSFSLYPGIEAPHSVHTYLSIPSVKHCNSHPHSLPITIVNCNHSQKQQRQKGVLVQLPCICERCIIAKVVLEKLSNTCLKVCQHTNTEGNVKQANLGSNIALCSGLSV